jgi:hypothetical protein
VSDSFLINEERGIHSDAAKTFQREKNAFEITRYQLPRRYKFPLKPDESQEFF